MNNTKATLLLIFILQFLVKGICQVNDAGLWISGNVEKQLTQSFAVTFSQELRMMENISEASTIFSDLGIDYKITRNLKASLHYRKIFDRKTEGYYASPDRFYFDLSYRRKWSPLIFTIRERVQQESERFKTSSNSYPEYYSRTKAAFKIDLDKKIRPYFSAELFMPLYPSQQDLFDKTRYAAGIEYQFHKQHMVDIGYLIQNKYGGTRENDYIICLAYYLTL